MVGMSPSVPPRPRGPSLSDQAAELSGVSRELADAALNASPSIFDRVGGPSFFEDLASKFYTRAYGDDAFRVLFANTTRADAERNQREFLAEIFGGPKLYSARKGSTALIGRHGPYPINRAYMVQWLEFMHDSLGELQREGRCDERVAALLSDYFRYMAAFIVEGRSYVNPGRTVGYYGRHEEGAV